MADYNFIRFFVVLTEKEKGYGAVTATGAKMTPSGYCKVESLNGQSVFSASVRGAVRVKEFEVFSVLEGGHAACMGSITAGEDGSAYAMFKTEANDVFGSGVDIRKIKGVFVTDDSNVVLEGYVNKNISREEKQELLQSIQKKPEPEMPEAAEQDGEPEEITFESTAEEQVREEEAILSAESFCAEESDVDPDSSADEAVADETPASGAENPIMPYMQTLAKLYAGLTGDTSFEQKKDEAAPCAAPREGDYWDMVKDYYGELFDKGECVAPFTLSKHNSKWILVNPYSNQNGSNGGNIIGLVYENGAVKYVVNGIPMTACGSTVAPTCSMLWMPSTPNPYGVLGYWLTFIDAGTGRLCTAAVAL